MSPRPQSFIPIDQAEGIVTGPDRYGDDIFYGLLIFPIFGSAIAAVAGYFRRTGRTRRLRLLQRLLDLTQKENDAPSLDARSTTCRSTPINWWWRSFADRSGRLSFGLVLDQVRFALSSRRAVLTGHGYAEAKPGAQSRR